MGKHDKPPPTTQPANDPPGNSDGQSPEVAKPGSGGHKK